MSDRPSSPLVTTVFYFDLSQFHGADAGTHAVDVSTGRAALWSLLHLPLLGTIQWIGTAIIDLVNARYEPLQHKGARVRWGLFASLSAYLALCTVQQLLHQGIGRGHRRVGKRARLAVRSMFILASALVVLAYGARWLAPPHWFDYGLFFAGATALAAFELYGRGRKHTPRPRI